MLSSLRLVLPFQLIDAENDIARDLRERAVEINALRRRGRRRLFAVEHRADLRFGNVRAGSFLNGRRGLYENRVASRKNRYNMLPDPLRIHLP